LLARSELLYAIACLCFFEQFLKAKSRFRFDIFNIRLANKNISIVRPQSPINFGKASKAFLERPKESVAEPIALQRDWVLMAQALELRHLMV